MTSYNSAVGPDGYRIQLETDNKEHYQYVQRAIRDCIDGNWNMYEHCLEAYLRKCELEWRAKNIPGGCCIDWLAPECESLEHIAAYLRQIGFKVERIVDEEPWPGEVHQWVETTSGIIVYKNTPLLRGFVARAAK